MKKNDWFKRLEKHEKNAMKILVPLHKKIKQTQKEICKSCPYREATHQMGCIECCPLDRA